jgi:DNA-binding CsgD family transcriptional regulator
MDTPLKVSQVQVARDEHSPPYALSLESTSRNTLRTALDPACYEAILLRLQSIIDVAGLWNAVQSILEELTPSDACVLYLNAREFSKTGYIPKIFATARASKFLQWMRPRQDGHVVPTLIHTTPGTKVSQMSDVLFDPRQLCHSEFFRRYMTPKRWHHIGCVLFWNRTHLTSEITLMRTAEQGAFSDRDIAALKHLHPHIEATLHRLTALEKRDRNNARWPVRVRIANSSAFDGAKLTPAESELVHLLHEGLSNKEIAFRLQKSIRTVKTQLTTIYRKYGVRSRTRLLASIHGSAEPTKA